MISPALRRPVFTLSSPDNTLTYKGNKLSELNFSISGFGFDQRASTVIFNEEEYNVNWNDNPMGYESEFTRIKNRYIDHQNYDGALDRTYFLFKNMLDQPGCDQVSGHVLIRGFLFLSRIYQLQKDWDNALEAAKFASELDPGNKNANLTEAFLYDQIGGKLDALGCYEQAVCLDPSDRGARRSLVTCYSVYGLGIDPRYGVERAEDELANNPHSATSYINLAKAFVDSHDHKKAYSVLVEGLDILYGEEHTHLVDFIAQDFAWVVTWSRELAA